MRSSFLAGKSRLGVAAVILLARSHAERSTEHKIHRKSCVCT